MLNKNAQTQVGPHVKWRFKFSDVHVNRNGLTIFLYQISFKKSVQWLSNCLLAYRRMDVQKDFNRCPKGTGNYLKSWLWNLQDVWLQELQGVSRKTHEISFKFIASKLDSWLWRSKPEDVQRQTWYTMSLRGWRVNSGGYNRILSYWQAIGLVVESKLYYLFLTAFTLANGRVKRTEEPPALSVDQ